MAGCRPACGPEEYFIKPRACYFGKSRAYCLYMKDFKLRGGKPSYGKKSFGDRGPAVFHKATCSECNKVCEVPFKPMNGKPVFCKDCFSKAGGFENKERGGDRFPKREFTPRFEAPKTDEVVKKQLEAINIKLDRLTAAVEALTKNK